MSCAFWWRAVWRGVVCAFIVECASKIDLVYFAVVKAHFTLVAFPHICKAGLKLDACWFSGSQAFGKGRRELCVANLKNFHSTRQKTGIVLQSLQRNLVGCGQGSFRRQDSYTLISPSSLCPVECGVCKFNGLLGANGLVSAATPRERRPSHRTSLSHMNTVSKIKRLRCHHI